MLLGVRIMIAPDSFKGSLAADQAAAAIAAGIARVRPAAEVVLRPVADGGEGTVAAALAAGYLPRQVPTVGPDGRSIEATFAFDGTTAVLELASAAGLGLLERPAPLTASTRGVGQLVLAALDAGAHRIVLGLGGSATSDGGAGMLQVLGVRLLDVDGADLPPGGAELRRLARIEVDGLNLQLAEVDLVIASDVDNPLIGRQGAAAVFGPQKGASAEEVAVLDSALNRFVHVLRRDVGVDVAALPGGGAAGGTAAGAVAMLGARLISGAALVCDLVGLGDALVGTDLVFTGEGSLDEQTLRGKAPAEVAARARAARVPCVALAGVVRLSADEFSAAGFAAAHALTEVEPDLARCLDTPADVLADLSERVLRRWPDGVSGGSS